MVEIISIKKQDIIKNLLYLCVAIPLYIL